jgi:hypothetical protein
MEKLHSEELHNLYSLNVGGCNGQGMYGEAGKCIENFNPVVLNRGYMTDHKGLC